MNPGLSRYIDRHSSRVDRTLASLLKRRPEQPETIRKAMGYSLFAGGKRLRPILVIAAAECCGTSAAKVLKTAAALEMIHTYSLIHDDLPAMDDDDLRRGKPTNHKVFGEAMAILAGDGLLTYAFETAAVNAAERGLSAKASAELVRIIARGAGTQGMVGGQVADLEAEDWKGRNHTHSRTHSLNGNGAVRSAHRGFKPGKLLEYIHLHKTAALIVASLEAGAILAQASERQRAALRDYGRAIGLAFQIADDILDVVGDKKKLGKKGSDAQNKKLTYASLYGIEKARGKAEALIARAHAALKPFAAKARALPMPPNASPNGRQDCALRALHDLADYIIQRDK